MIVPGNSRGRGGEYGLGVDGLGGGRREHTPGLKPGYWETGERPKAEALGYLPGEGGGISRAVGTDGGKAPGVGGGWDSSGVLATAGAEAPSLRMTVVRSGCVGGSCFVLVGGGFLRGWGVCVGRECVGMPVMLAVSVTSTGGSGALFGVVREMLEKVQSRGVGDVAGGLGAGC